MNMNISEHAKARDTVLQTLDEAKIKQFMRNSGVPVPPGELFWFSVHMAITASPVLPKDFRELSVKWLKKNGYESLL